jgi:hypothetical protein
MSKKRRWNWAASLSMFHSASDELSVQRRTQRERHILRRSRFERTDHTAEDESGRDIPRGRELLGVQVGLGETRVPAPLQHLGPSRLTIRAHFNLCCLLLPALSGMLIDLSHAYITTVSAGVRSERRAAGMCGRSTDKQDHLCRLTAVQCSIHWA